MLAKTLVIVTTLACLLAFAPMVSAVDESTVGEENNLANHESNKQDTGNEDVCRSKVCNDRARLINEYINTSADPCEDFYAYACDKWISQNQNRTRYDAFIMLYHKFLTALMGILQRMEIVYENQTVLNKVAVLYNACLAVPQEDDGRTDLLEIMNANGLAQWPIISDGNGSMDNVGNVTDVLLKVGMESVIQFYIEKSLVSSDNVVKIYPLDEISPIDGDKVNISAKFVNSSLQDSDVESLIASLEDFQKKWTNFTESSRGKTKFPPYPGVKSLGELEQLFHLPLRRLLNKEFNKTNIVVQDEEKVEVYTMRAYEILAQFVQSANPVDLFNYMGYQYMLTWGEHTFLRTLYRSAGLQVPSRSYHCVLLAHKAMTEVTSSLYAEGNVSPGAKAQVEEMARRLKLAFNDSLQRVTWMDEKNKTIAVEKLEKIGAKVGYPPWLLNTTVLEHLFRYVPNFDKNTSFVKMMYDTSENNDRTMMEKLREEYKKDSEWHFKLSPVTTFYYPSNNEFVVPAGGLRSPFYDFGLPWSLNLGGIGTVIGHELTHAFAGRTNHFDGDGKPFQIWTNDEYKEKTECFAKQYGNITDGETNLKLNGKQTLDENIGDNSGLELAYTVYEKMMREDCDNTTTSLETLPGMSGPQLFFITHAMLWCSVVTTDYLKTQIQEKHHSPNKYRVKLPLQNLRAFAVAFNCSSESAMTKKPDDQCSLWRPTLVTGSAGENLEEDSSNGIQK